MRIALYARVSTADQNCAMTSRAMGLGSYG